MLRQALGEIQRRRPADISREVPVHFLLERGIGLRFVVGALELENERHQRLCDEAAAIDTEMAALVRAGAERIGLLHAHTIDSFGRSSGAAARATAMNS